jgi:hypothetical protein
MLQFSLYVLEGTFLYMISASSFLLLTLQMGAHFKIVAQRNSRNLKLACSGSLQGFPVPLNDLKPSLFAHELM